MKNNIKLLLFILSSFYSVETIAADGVCSPINGPATLTYDIGNMTITDPGNNIAGKVLPDQILSAPSKTTTINCTCSGGPYTYVWIWGDTNLPNPQTIGDYTYFDIPGNEYAQVGIKVKTINGYVSVPFGPIHNKVNSSTTNYSCNEDIPLNSGGKNTGGQIEVSVRLKRSVVGQSVINNVLIASTYWTVGDTGGSSHGAMATTNTYLNGTITVPQNCVINAGTQVVVELGDIYSSDFKVAGEKPANYTPKTFSIPVECNDMSATANLTLRLQGTPSVQFPDALQSDNKDVGVVVTDESNNPLVPNNATSVIPFTLDDSFRSDIILHAFPVGTTGTPPKEGVFTTLAYLRVDFS